jgi:hypothetical protein
VSTSTNLTAKENACLAALRANREGSYGDGWEQVYLDNALADLPGWTRHSFDGVLGTLTQKGLVRAQGDGFFVDVRPA